MNNVNFYSKNAIPKIVCTLPNIQCHRAEINMADNRLVTETYDT
jgi:hypothetical protein